MSDVLDKVSSYNIFNYLLPGSLFALIADRYSSYSIIQSDILIGLFSYYFIGLVVSRIGSLLLEPLFKKVGFLNFTDYKNFVSASKADKKLDALLEANNMYRTLSSLFVCLLSFIVFDKLAAVYPVLKIWTPYVAATVLFLLFLFSWRKQTAYITTHVNTRTPSQ